MNHPPIKASEAHRHPIVTTHNARYGSTGLGRLVDGVLYISGGNGWYYSAIEGQTWTADHGAGYRERVRQLFCCA